MEVWKDIEGYEGVYRISDHGRIMRVGKGLMRQNTDSYGYKYIAIKHNGVSWYPKVHRLVAMHFIPNPNHYPCVNHKDENKTNNIAENLEWCTHKYNTNYGTCIERRAKSCRKPILQFSIDGDFIAAWDGVIDASKALRVDSSSITKAAKKKRISAGGFVWEYAKNVEG